MYILLKLYKEKRKDYLKSKYVHDFKRYPTRLHINLLMSIQALELTQYMSQKTTFTFY